METEIASNKRRSVVFIFVFFLVWIGIGALGGFIFSLFKTTHSLTAPTQSHRTAFIATGIVIALILASIGFLYSITSGARLVLKVSGAIPADPVRYQRLHNLVETLAIGEGIPKPAVFIIEDPSPNAFATGLSPDKAAITFTTGLLTIMNREELEGVTSHEMSHIKNHDVRLILVVSTMIGMAALLASVLWRSIFFVRGRNSGGVAVIIAVTALLLTVVGFLVGPLIQLALSRRRESLADASGVELTRNPAGLLSALKKLQQNDKPFKKFNHATSAMCIDDPLQHHEAWYHRLYDTHPPIEDRIAALEAIAEGRKV